MSWSVKCTWLSRHPVYEYIIYRIIYIFSPPAWIERSNLSPRRTSRAIHIIYISRCYLPHVPIMRSITGRSFDPNEFLDPCLESDFNDFYCKNGIQGSKEISSIRNKDYIDTTRGGAVPDSGRLLFLPLKNKQTNKKINNKLMNWPIN